MIGTETVYSAHTLKVLERAVNEREIVQYAARHFGENHAEVKRGRATLRMVLSILADLIAIDLGNTEAAPLAMAYQALADRLGITLEKVA